MNDQPTTAQPENAAPVNAQPVAEQPVEAQPAIGPPTAEQLAAAQPVEEGAFDRSLFPEGEVDIESARAAWDAGKEEVEKGSPIGVFTAKIIVAELRRAKSSGKMQICYELEFLDGPGVGHQVIKRDGMETPVQTSITMTGLRKLGIDPLKLDLVTEMPAVLLSLSDQVVQVECKTSGEYYNINFRKRIGPAPTGSDDNPTPF